MFTVENLTKALKLFNSKIQANKEFLSELDTPIGDGDHGNNMARGMTAVVEILEEKNPTTIQDIFKTSAMALIGKVGGASGPLYGTAMMEMAKKSGETDEALPILEAGIAGIEKRGNSQPGEKTMLDLWQPAIEAIRDSGLNQEQLTTFTEATKGLIAKKGRASYLGERSVGHIDPGAMSSRYLFESMIEAGVFND